MPDPISPLSPEQAAKQEARALKEGYVHRVLVGLDQFANVIAAGKPDETISSRWARGAEAGKWWGVAGSKFLNLFQSNHGAKAQAGDTARAEQVEKLEQQSGGFVHGDSQHQNPPSRL